VTDPQAAPSGARIHHFGPFELDLALGELRSAGQRITIQELPLRLLALLLERPGEIVSRDELQARLWPGAVLLDVEHSINTAVKKLRRALGDSPETPRWIETVPRRGYRFIAPIGSSSLEDVVEPDPRSEAAALLRRMPFVGRSEEREHFRARLEAAMRGEGSFVLVLGEAGIGKTRLLDEVSELGRGRGLRVASGRCLEGEWSAPYGPFSYALAECVRSYDDAQLRAAAPFFADLPTKLFPALRERIPELPESPPLPPDEERERVSAAVVGLVREAARAHPLLLVLDDLQWADPGTLDVFARLARAAVETGICVVAGLRYPDPDASAAFEAVGALHVGPLCGPLRLSGLSREQLGELLDRLAGREVEKEGVDLLHVETGGNPLFLREVILHLVEEGKIERTHGTWGPSPSLGAQDLPATVREVVERRVGRLSPDGQRLLRVASVFPASFDLAVAFRVAGLETPRALSALVEVIAANLIREAEEGDRYEFCHALVRSGVYGRLSPSRRTRLHRRIAEELARMGSDSGTTTVGEIADHYLRSAELPGAEAGLGAILEAAAESERAGSHARNVRFLRTAAEVATDPGERARIHARLGLALAWAGQREEAARVSALAGEELAAVAGGRAAAAHLADAADALWWGALDRQAWMLAEQGLRHLPSGRGPLWARLVSHALMGREAADPANPGVPRDDAERRELSRVVFADPAALELNHHNELWRYAIFESRDDVLLRAPRLAHFLGFWAGEYRAALDLTQDAVGSALARHRTMRAALFLALAARLESALGDVAAAEESLSRAEALAEGRGSTLVGLWLGGARAELTVVRGEGFEAALPLYEAAFRIDAPETRWAMPITKAGGAYAYAQVGRKVEALRQIDAAQTAIEVAPGWSASYPATLHLAIGASWTLELPVHAESFERNLREKVLAPDFRHPHADGRLSLARLCALTGRHDEALEWFARARAVLDEQGARPLRAITDFDEAWMYVRRGASGDRERARPLLVSAIAQFEAIGMPGWVRRARGL
jgi:DNA-binding winged helix-turn-helix (wHTH) protein/tetratricopeptide (TPR) repeat protein